MRFEYVKASIKDLVAHPSRTSTGKLVVQQLDIDGRPCEPSKRFWTSLMANYGFSNNIFTYFTHEEVFNRISEVAPNDKLNITLEISKDSDGEVRERMLAATNPKKIVAKHDDLIALLEKNKLDISNIDYGYGKKRSASFGRGAIGTGGTMLTSTGANSDPNRILGDGITHNDGTIAGATPEEQANNLPVISYNEGIIRSIHKVRNGQEFCIGADEFSNRFIMDTPIDGYGKPAAYLMLLRIICSNLAIGYSNVFRSEISLGKGEDKFDYALNRAIEGFNNEEGFAALRERFEMAQKSWCSINEINKAYKALIRLHSKGEVKVAKRYQSDEKDQFEGTLVAEGSPIIRAFHTMVGDLHRAYGLANLDALSIRKQATLPSGCVAYDLINFLSETSTHHATPAGQRVLQAHIGDLVSAEFDLESSRDAWPEWRDFLINSPAASENLQEAKRL